MIIICWYHWPQNIIVAIVNWYRIIKTNLISDICDIFVENVCNRDQIIHNRIILTHLGLVSHIYVMKNSSHFPSDAYMRRKSLYFSYRPRGRPTKLCEAKIFHISILITQKRFYCRPKILTFVKPNLFCPSDKLSWQPGCPVLNINIQGNFCISQGNGSSDNLPENLV